MQNIAHRGASVDALENTLEAFALAVEQGADMIETDLHLLRDGVVALYHDDEIGGVPVGELTLAELRGHLPRAPTLQEALDRFGDALAAGVIHGWLDGDLAAGLRYGTTLAALALSQFGDMVITNKEELLKLSQSGGSTIVR